MLDKLQIDVIECKEKSKRVGSQVLTTLDDDPSHYFRFGNKDITFKVHIVSVKFTFQ